MVAQRNNPQTTVIPPVAGKSTTLQFLFDLDSESCSTQNDDEDKIQIFDPRIEELTSIIVYCTEYRSNDKESGLKRLKLTQLLSIIKTSTTPLSDQTLEFLFKMLASNLFRPLPPPSSSTVSVISPEDDDCIAAPAAAWPHLQIIYDILLRLIIKKDVKTLRQVQFIGRSFVLNLLVLFQSGDPRERDAVKNVVHRIYSKFTFYRSFMRKAMTDVFLHYVYETDHRQNGIGEILEIWGSIINGFTVPLKEEHKLFLSRVLIPLHKPKNMQVYHRQLAYCVSQFVQKEAEIGGVVIGKILKYWPVTNCGKEVLLIGELEEIVENMDPERALYVCNNEQFLKAVSQELDEVFPVLVEAIEKNLTLHWNKNVRELTHNVKTLLEDLEPVLYRKCLEMNEIHWLTTRLDENTRRKRWERIEMVARTNN
ncbi:Armadillo-type fold [Cynara cardunculus var. scolymus]|uniref:Armadillo-type fold n=1 Tax=Cynara cardunculus var. scolymus TaxID=59895 RepID=A0A118JYT0_CYNCS|nr:Armadillo-type fold [Cynara cardunculus var. scolymus]